MIEPREEKPSPSFNFEGKSYDFNSLQKKARQLVNALRVADTQVRRHQNTLQILEVGRQSMIKQLQEELKSVVPLD